MQEKINMENDLLSGMLFDGISFSSFKFDDLSILCCKYHLSTLNFRKKKYLNDIYKLINKKNPDKNCEFRNELYFISRTVKALLDSSILLSNNNKEIKLYKKVKGTDDVLVSNLFSIDDLPYNISTRKISLFIYNDNDKEKYKALIEKMPDISFISLDDENDEEYIYDRIKVKLLRDESDVYFIVDGIYSNYIANSLYSLDKIAITL